jgi:hypothetical protein
MTLVRLKTSIMGAYFGIEARNLFSVSRGDVIDLADPEWVLKEVAADRVELKLDGPVGECRRGANVKDLAAAKKMVSEAAPRRPKQPERTRAVIYDGGAFIYPSD